MDCRSVDCRSVNCGSDEKIIDQIIDQIIEEMSVDGYQMYEECTRVQAKLASITEEQANTRIEEKEVRRSARQLRRPDVDNCSYRSRRVVLARSFVFGSKWPLRQRRWRKHVHFHFESLSFSIYQ